MRSRLRSWVPSFWRHMFHTPDLTWEKTDRWLYALLAPEQSPAHHFRALRITIRGVNWFPDKFFEHSPVHECAKAVSVQSERLSGVLATSALEVFGICNIFYHQHWWIRTCGSLRYYGATTESGRSVIMVFLYNGGQECAARDWDGPKGKIW